MKKKATIPTSKSTVHVLSDNTEYRVVESNNFSTEDLYMFSNADLRTIKEAVDKEFKRRSATKFKQINRNNQTV